MRAGMSRPQGVRSDDGEELAELSWSARAEPVDLWRTLSSTESPTWRRTGSTRSRARSDDAAPARARTRCKSEGRRGFARIEGDGVGARDGVVLAETVRHMLRLDADLSAFYEAARADADLAWAAAGAGRMLRSPTVFEDVVKTICTTNCAWSATVRMVGALVSELGVEAPGGRRTFPTPEAMAEAPETFYKDVVRAGYRGPYLRSLAAAVAHGSLALEALNDPELSDDEVAARLLALPGCGPYATAHMMMLLGRYSRLILDSWTRPARAPPRAKGSDKTIERRSAAIATTRASRSGSTSHATGPKKTRESTRRSPQRPSVEQSHSRFRDTSRRRRRRAGASSPKRARSPPWP